MVSDSNSIDFLILLYVIILFRIIMIISSLHRIMHLQDENMTETEILLKRIDYLKDYGYFTSFLAFTCLLGLFNTIVACGAPVVLETIHVIITYIKNRDKRGINSLIPLSTSV